MRNLSEDSWRQSRDLNRGLPEYNSRVLPLYQSVEEDTNKMNLKKQGEFRGLETVLSSCKHGNEHLSSILQAGV
jgi:hypothetical protein